jgi:AraC-like DNA-binding protein
MRLEAACRALEETRLPLKSIATLAGYGDEQRLRRAFQRQFGTSPATHRLRFSTHNTGEYEAMGQRGLASNGRNGSKTDTREFRRIRQSSG